MFVPCTALTFPFPVALPLPLNGDDDLYSGKSTGGSIVRLIPYGGSVEMLPHSHTHFPAEFSVFFPVTKEEDY